MLGLTSVFFLCDTGYIRTFIEVECMRNSLQCTMPYTEKMDFTCFKYVYHLSMTRKYYIDTNIANDSQMIVYKAT